MRRLDLPYFDERQAKIDMIVIHCLAYNVNEAMESFHCHQVSAHYLIDEKGRIYRLVDDNKRAWHAGVSFWRGQTGLNHNSIGIELCSMSLGQDAYPFKQISALIRLCRRLKRKYHIKKERILGHSDIAVSRKPDPGKAFPWSYLARHNLGLWYDLKNAAKMTIEDEAELLGMIGYDTADLNAAKVAFVRHFMGENVQKDGISNLLEKPFETPLKVLKKDYLNVLKATAYGYRKKNG